MPDNVPIFLAIIPMAAAIVGILRFLHLYNNYQRCLREDHPDEYRRLALKDEFAKVFGEWVRWKPVHWSPYIIYAIFNPKQDYGDLLRLQKKALLWLIICVAGFILSLLLFAKFGTR
jgi:hypothetical protein